jgi:hypothetical protein
LHLHPRVDLPDDRYTLALEGGDEGAVGELQYVNIAQDLDQSPEGPKAKLASKGKLQITSPSFYNYAIIFSMIVHLRFKS